MRPADKKAPGRDPEALHSTIAFNNTTIQEIRDNLARCWWALRALRRAVGMRP